MRHYSVCLLGVLALTLISPSTSYACSYDNMQGCSKIQKQALQDIDMEKDMCVASAQNNEAKTGECLMTFAQAVKDITDDNNAAKEQRIRSVESKIAATLAKINSL